MRTPVTALQKDRFSIYEPPNKIKKSFYDDV